MPTANGPKCTTRVVAISLSLVIAPQPCISNVHSPCRISSLALLKRRQKRTHGRSCFDWDTFARIRQTPHFVALSRAVSGAHRWRLVLREGENACTTLVIYVDRYAGLNCAIASQYRQVDTNVSCWCRLGICCDFILRSGNRDTDSAPGP